MDEQHSLEDIRLVDTQREGRQFAVDNLAEERSPEAGSPAAVDSPVAARILAGVHIPVSDILAAVHTLVAARNPEADIPEAAHIPAERILAAGTPVVHIPAEDKLVGHNLAADSQPDIPVLVGSHSLADTDIQLVDKDIPVAPDMVAAEFQVVVYFQKQACH